jgi:AcrR family transcriptional regulator
MTEYMRKKKEETRNLIYRTAMDLFLEKGYENTPVDEIVDRAEVSKGTFFNYFPTKAAILEEWFTGWIGDILEGAALEPGAELVDNLAALVASMAATESKFLTITGWLIVEGFTARLRGGREEVSEEGSGREVGPERREPIVDLILRIMEISEVPRLRDPDTDRRGAALMLGTLWYGTILVCIEHPGYDPGRMLADALKVWYRGTFLIENTPSEEAP